MALIVEDGSIVPGANSYSSGQDFANYAISYGINPPDTLAECEVFLRMGMDWLESLIFRGEPVDPYHTTKFPRRGLYTREGHPLSHTSIPHGIQYGQLSKSLEIMVAKREQESGTPERGPLIMQKLGDMQENFAVIPGAQLRKNVTAFAKAETHVHPFRVRGGCWKVRT